MTGYALVGFLFTLLSGSFVAGCATGKGVVQTGQPIVAHRDYVTDLDFTSTTEFDLADFSGTKPLREFGTNNVAGFSDTYIFGEYRSPMDITEGHNFYVFPDGCFVIEAFCDVCEPKTLASGRWILRGNELLVFDLVENTNSSPMLGMKWVKDNFGSVERLRLFVTEHDDYIGDTILVAQATLKNATHVGWKYIRRVEYYRDWPNEQRTLLKK